MIIRISRITERDLPLLTRDEIIERLNTMLDFARDTSNPIGDVAYLVCNEGENMTAEYRHK